MLGLASIGSGLERFQGYVLYGVQTCRFLICDSGVAGGAGRAPGPFNRHFGREITQVPGHETGKCSRAVYRILLQPLSQVAAPRGGLCGTSHCYLCVVETRPIDEIIHLVFCCILHPAASITLQTTIGQHIEKEHCRSTACRAAAVQSHREHAKCIVPKGASKMSKGHVGALSGGAFVQMDTHCRPLHILSYFYLVRLAE